MIDIESLFDPYNRQARLYPSLLAFLPVLIALVSWFPDLLTSSVSSAAIGLIGGCGVLYLLAALSRSRGKRVETRLLREWGGWPTTLWLRFSDPNLPSATKERYHRALAQRIPGLSIPQTPAAETAAPDLADDAYRSATEWLKEHCRKEKNGLVHKENIEYGFRKNTLGLRGVALLMHLAAIIGIVLAVLYRLRATTPYLIDQVPLTAFGGLAVIIASLFFWAFVVSDRWVREAADQYARALLATCEVL